MIDFKTFFQSLCFIYGVNTEDFVGQGEQIEKSKIGKLTDDEAKALLSYLRDSGIQPYKKLYIPNIPQLTIIYNNEIKNNQQTKYTDCDLCDSTGFVPFTKIIRGTEYSYVAYCHMCARGRSMKKKAESKKISPVKGQFYNEVPGMDKNDIPF